MSLNSHGGLGLLHWPAKILSTLSTFPAFQFRFLSAHLLPLAGQDVPLVDIMEPCWPGTPGAKGNPVVKFLSFTPHPLCLLKAFSPSREGSSSWVIPPKRDSVRSSFRVYWIVTNFTKWVFRVVVVYTLNPSHQDAETSGSLWVRDQPGLQSWVPGELAIHRETLTKPKTNTNMFFSPLWILKPGSAFFSPFILEKLLSWALIFFFFNLHNGRWGNNIYLKD